MRRCLLTTLYLCAAITLAAFTCAIFRHGPAVIIYLPALIMPFILLHIPRQNRVAAIVQLCLLIIPAGIALGSMNMCGAPPEQPDGKVFGWLVLTAAWGIFTTPFCCIPLLFKDKPELPPMNSLTFRRATPLDLPALRTLYNEIIDAMDGAPSHAQWKRGGYPTDAFLQTKAAIGELWVAEKAGVMAGAMVLNSECNPGYAQADWRVECEPHEVMAIHTLGVSPRMQGQGVGKAMVQYAITYARRQGCKSVRLDVIDTNPAACEFYTRMGFINHGQYLLDYPGAVCTHFTLCELPLQ